MRLPTLAGTSRATDVASSLAFPLGVWVIWRVCQATVVLLAGEGVVDTTFLWDGNWYRNLLANGYVMVDDTFATQQNVNFFPGIVWLTSPFAWLLGDRTAALLVANLTGAAAFVAVFGATRAVTDLRVAQRAVIGLALWPGSLFLAAYYTEGLFLAATAGAIWAASDTRHRIGMAAAVIAGCTRSIGFVLGPILAVARFARVRRIDRVVVGYALSGPIGLALVAATQWVTVGDPLAFAKSQAAWGRTLAPPWVPFRRAFGGVLGSLPDLPLSHNIDLAVILLIPVVLAVVTWRFRANPETWAFLGWGWAAYLLPLLTNLPSTQLRFALAAWPALAVLGPPDTPVIRRLRLVAMAIGVVLSVIVTVEWSRGGWIG